MLYIIRPYLDMLVALSVAVQFVQLRDADQDHLQLLAGLGNVRAQSELSGPEIAVPQDPSKGREQRPVLLGLTSSVDLDHTP